MRLGEVKRQHFTDVGLSIVLRQLGEHMQQIRIRLDTAGPTRQHLAVDDGAGLRSGNGIAEQPGLASRGKWSDVPLDHVIVDGRMTVIDVASQVVLLIARVTDCLAGQTFGQNPWRLLIEPEAQRIQQRYAVGLAQSVRRVRPSFPFRQCATRQRFELV